MSLLVRQTLREFLAVFAAALVIMSSGIILFDTVKVLQNHGFGLPQLVLAVPYLLPFVVRTAMQAAVLYAACYVYGRMGAVNELLTLNALGLSIRCVIWPVIVLAGGLSLVCVWLDDLGASWGHNGMARLGSDAKVDICYNRLRLERMIDMGEFELVVQRVQGRRLIRPVVDQQRADGGRLKIEAEEGELTMSPEAALAIVLHHGTIRAEGQFTLSFRDTFTQLLPFPDKQHSAITLERLSEQQRKVDRLANGSANAPNDPELAKRYSDELKTLREMRMHFHQKWASSFSCLAFALVGVPWAVRQRQSSFLSSFFVCFLPVVLLYQPLQFLSCSFVQANMLSPWWLYTNDAIFMTAGVIQLSRLLHRQ
jgi:lipopolysaccharide export system permease protein